MSIQKGVILLLAGSLLFGTSYGLVEEMNLQDLVNKSTEIVKGKVLEVKSAWDEEGSKIFTYVKIAIDEYWKGEGPREMVLRVPGGTVGDITLWVEDAPSFEVGEEVVLFLNDIEFFRLTGWFQGKYKIINGRAVNVEKGESIPIEEFKRRVIQYLK